MHKIAFFKQMLESAFAARPTMSRHPVCNSELSGYWNSRPDEGRRAAMGQHFDPPSAKRPIGLERWQSAPKLHIQTAAEILIYGTLTY